MYKETLTKFIKIKNTLFKLFLELDTTFFLLDFHQTFELITELSSI